MLQCFVRRLLAKRRVQHARKEKEILEGVEALRSRIAAEVVLQPAPENEERIQGWKP